VIIGCLSSAFVAAPRRADDKGNDRAVTQWWFEDAEVTVIVETFGLRRKAARPRTSRYGVERRRNCEEIGSRRIIGVRMIVFAEY
jgi:hypothetical protein